MVILALDTTTRAGSVAVVRDEHTLALIEGEGARTHGERLPGELSAALAAAGLDTSALDLLVVASGPGAFTGLRIGLAAMQGLAMVSGVPVIGISALDALAETVADAMTVTWMDAQRGEVFSAVYPPRPRAAAEVPEPMMPPSVGAPAAILDALPAGARAATFIGDGALRYRDEIAAWSGGRAHVVDSTPLLAAALASIGRRRAARGEAGPPHSLQPLYVRRPDAEIERGRQASS